MTILEATQKLEAAGCEYRVRNFNGGLALCSWYYNGTFGEVELHGGANAEACLRTLCGLLRAELGDVLAVLESPEVPVDSPEACRARMRARVLTSRVEAIAAPLHTEHYLDRN